MIMPKFISTALNIFWVTTPTNKGTSQNLRKFYTLRALRVCTDRSVSQHISCSNRARLSIHVLSCHLLLPVWSVFRNIIFITTSTSCCSFPTKCKRSHYLCIVTQGGK